MNENNKEIIVHAKQLFWEFMAEFYLPDKPIFFYINLVNRVNQQKKTNEIFKKLCKTHAFLKFFVEILRYIRSNFDPYYFLLFSNEQQINDVKIFKKKYPFAELDFIEHIPFLLSFPLIKNKPIMNFLPDINDINVISFFSDLEEKKIRKDFKNLEISVDFLKEANSFIKNNKNSADINNYVTQCLEKTLKTLLFLPDSLEKIKKCFVVLTEILTFTDFIFKFGETHEDKNIFEITMRINELRNNFKKCLKSIFWSNFEETLKNKKKKNKTMHEIFDEKTSESLFSNIFCKLYRDIQNFVKNFQALKLLEWSFLIYLKVFYYFISHCLLNFILNRHL